MISNLLNLDNPSVTSLALNSADVPDSVAIYNTKYYSVQRGAANTTLSVTLTVTSAQVNARLFVSSTNYPADQCLLANCRVTPPATTCSLNGLEGCNTGASDTVMIGVKYVYGPSDSMNFTITNTATSTLSFMLRTNPFRSYIQHFIANEYSYHWLCRSQVFSSNCSLFHSSTS
jgi:hypothetical protein